MTALLLLGILLFSFGVAFSANESMRLWKRRLIALTIVIGFFLAIFPFGKVLEKQTYRASLDGNNPYKKEYIYKQVDSTMVIVDSVYTKIK